MNYAIKSLNAGRVAVSGTVPGKFVDTRVTASCLSSKLLEARENGRLLNFQGSYNIGQGYPFQGQ